MKLIILGRLAALKKRNEKVLQEMLMDILRTLSAPNIEIRRRTLDLALELLSPRNVEEVVQLLKKEIVKTESPEHGMCCAVLCCAVLCCAVLCCGSARANRCVWCGAGKADDYRKLLVETMHQCAVRFPEVVSSVVHILMNYLGDENAANGLDGTAHPSPSPFPLPPSSSPLLRASHHSNTRLEFELDSVLCCGVVCGVVWCGGSDPFRA